jgi:predicted  nucleic acid-binding Zn-ribbon protein
MFFYGEDPDKEHSHKCKQCGTVWRHQGWMRANKEAHRCPTCGVENYVPVGMEMPEPTNPYATK